jgi:hypothetical protein
MVTDADPPPMPTAEEALPVATASIMTKKKLQEMGVPLEVSAYILKLETALREVLWQCQHGRAGSAPSDGIERRIESPEFTATQGDG